MKHIIIIIIDTSIRVNEQINTKIISPFFYRKKRFHRSSPAKSSITKLVIRSVKERQQKKRFYKMVAASLFRAIFTTIAIGGHGDIFGSTTNIEGSAGVVGAVQMTTPDKLQHLWP